VVVVFINGDKKIVVLLAKKSSNIFSLSPLTKACMYQTKRKEKH